jgi:hypothetical protein
VLFRSKPLTLTEAEQKDLIAFLDTLTGDVTYRARTSAAAADAGAGDARRQP